MLMRHGETVWNAEHRFTTRTDVELSAAGLEQAAEAARALSAVGIDRVFASPLSRARRTAELIAAAQATDCPVLVDERLTEIDAGPFEGMTSAEIEEFQLLEFPCAPPVATLTRCVTWAEMGAQSTTATKVATIPNSELDME